MVELTWTTPSDANETDTDGTDFDLHLRDEEATWWFDDTTGPGSDCYSGNLNPDWGVASDGSDDPLLEMEDNDGAGPEIIAIDSPSIGMTYTAGVHGSLDNGFGPSCATIEIYVLGDLRYSTPSCRTLVQGDVWEVVEVGWIDADAVFSTIDTVTGD